LRGYSRRPAKSSENGVKQMEYLIAGFVSLALCVYLLYALLRPEKF
jgi:K+-transporting ATPase KdpF subunit